ncbi:MAG: helix-turn-helix domain-containing protein [Granulosicoccaceae bacterium]
MPNNPNEENIDLNVANNVTESAEQSGGEQSDTEGTAIQRCVQDELARYFEMLDGQAPRELHRLVMGQVESALIAYVMEECRGNQSRAAQWLGISRGTLRGKLPETTRSQ